MADIYKPYTGSNIIKVDGVCYEWMEFTPGEIESPGVVEGEFAECIACFTDGGPNHGYEECDFRYRYLKCEFDFYLLFTTGAVFVNVELEYSDASEAGWDWDDGNIDSPSNSIGHIYQDGEQFHDVKTYNANPGLMTTLNLQNSGITTVYTMSLSSMVNLLLSTNDIEDIALSPMVDLEILELEGNQLTDIDISFNTKLILVNLSNNQLDGSAIDNVLMSLDSHGLSDGVVDVTDNLENPTCAGQQYIASLEGKGWTVLYDLPLSDCGFIFSVDRFGGYITKRNAFDFSSLGNKSGRFSGVGGISGRIYGSNTAYNSQQDIETTILEFDVDNLVTVNSGITTIGENNQSVGGISNRLYRSSLIFTGINAYYRQVVEIDPNSLIDIGVPGIGGIPTFGARGVGGTANRLYLANYNGGRGDSNSINELDPVTFVNVGSSRTINDLTDVGGTYNVLYYSDSDGQFVEIDLNTLATLNTYGGDHPQGVGGNK